MAVITFGHSWLGFFLDFKDIPEFLNPAWTPAQSYKKNDKQPIKSEMKANHYLRIIQCLTLDMQDESFEFEIHVSNIGINLR